MAFSSRWFLLSVLVLGPSHAAGLAAEPTKAEIAKATKPATALVDATPAFGSAFCVHENGLFLTNNHVVRLVPDSGTVKIVLNSGLKDEKKLTAKILRRDAKLDLALLQMEGTDKFPALQLGDDEKLGELDELIAFGFPFGTELAKPGENPAISVTTSSISALRRDQEKKLSRIQLDGALNPGNSGGPVVDRGGKVVGVVVSGIRGSGISLAIPVSHVRGFLEKPVIAVSIPPVLPAAKAKPVTITATVASVTDETDYDVELIATAAGGERKVAMKKDGRGYTASISLFADTPVKLRAEIAYPDGTVSVPVENLPYTAGAAKLTLAETKSIRFGESGEAALADNIKVAGPFTGLSEIPVKVGEQTVTFSTAAATSMTITAPPAANSFTVTVIARRKAMEVGRSETTAYLVGTERGGADALLKGKFIKPAKTAKPTTSLKVVSTSGDYIGGGKSYSYTEKELTARSNHGGGVSVNVQSGGGPGKGGDWWTLDVCAAKGERLVVGEYKNAMRFPFHDDKQPGLSFSGNGRGSNTLSGEFVVWELEMDGDKVIKAAIDFVQRGDGKGAPLVGVFRWNSSFE